MRKMLAYFLPLNKAGIWNHHSLCVCVLHLQEQVTDFHETWHEGYNTEKHSNIILLNILQSVITCQMHQLVRWKQYLHHKLYILKWYTVTYILGIWNFVQRWIIAYLHNIYLYVCLWINNSIHDNGVKDFGMIWQILYRQNLNFITSSPQK
jgi:hypothetical protein